MKCVTPICSQFISVQFRRYSAACAHSLLTHPQKFRYKLYMESAVGPQWLPYVSCDLKQLAFAQNDGAARTSFASSFILDFVFRYTCYGFMLDIWFTHFSSSFLLSYWIKFARLIRFSYREHYLHSEHEPIYSHIYEPPSTQSNWRTAQHWSKISNSSVANSSKSTAAGWGRWPDHIHVHSHPVPRQFCR